MTPKEFRGEQQNIVSDYYVDQWGDSNMPEIMERLEALDIAYAAAQSPQDAFYKDAYYAFIRQMDRAYDSLKQSEGVPSHEIAAIDVMVATLVKRAEMLKGIGS
jgi:hypothetical protein